jgi:hypothetical protein
MRLLYSNVGVSIKGACKATCLQCSTGRLPAFSPTNLLRQLFPTSPKDNPVGGGISRMPNSQPAALPSLVVAFGRGEMFLAGAGAEQ